MTLPYEIHLARRDLTRYPWMTATMTFGLAVAILVMVYIPSTMSSFYEDMIDRIVEQNSPHITIWPVERRHGQLAGALQNAYGSDTNVDLADRTDPRSHYLNGHKALAREVASVEGITAVAAFVRGNATANRGRVDLRLDLEGITTTEFAKVVNITEHFPDRRLPALGPSDIAIGFRAAKKLGVHIGEHIRVASAKVQMLMRVRGIFHSGYYDKDMYHAYVTLPTAQRMFQMGNQVSGLAARCHDVADAADVSQLVRNSTGQKVRNWRDDNASLLAEITMVKRITTFVNVLVALVSAAGMANVFSVFVLNRQKELAILRAVGASKMSLRAIIMLEAMFIWAVGTVLGFIAAMGVMAYEQAHPMAVSAETYGISSYATNPQLSAFITAAALAAVTMAASAWWGGRKATKLNPVEVIFGR